MEVEAFADFYRGHYRLILTVAQQRLRGYSDAEDVTAEVFRIAWKYANDGNVLSLPWLYQVLRNVVGNEYRRLGRSAKFLEAAGPVLLTVSVDGSDVDAMTVRMALLRLSAEDRDVLYMAYWEDLTGQEIAGILGCTNVAVRVRLSRARRKLRALLEEAEFEREEVKDG